MSPRPPSLSVVLPTDRLETIGETLAALRGQSVADRIELVVVAPGAEAIDAAALGGGLARFVTATCDGIERTDWLTRARAAGARAATAPVIAFGETHSYPEPGWAEALLAAHEGPWAAVGARMRNANPDSRISWANLFVDFGPWVERLERGPMHELPGHNTSYKRDVLLARDEPLSHALSSETLLAAELRAEGHDLLYEPAAATRHVNLATAFWFLQRFDHDRVWATVRASDWGPLRRTLYVAGAPLIPLVRFARLWPELRRAGHGADLGLAALILLGLAAGAAGEAAGYLTLRADESLRRCQDVEIHRHRYAGATAEAVDA